jgi:hypothetical protein
MRLPQHRVIHAAVFLLCVQATAAQQLETAQQPEAAQPAPSQKRPQRVSGRVVSAVDDHPLAHAMVSLQELKAGQNVLSTIADSEGHYRFDAVPPGKYRLLGQASGYEAATYLSHGQYGTAIVTGVGLETDSLVLQLTPLARISGRILDEAGEPVAEASVELYRTAPGSSNRRIMRYRTLQTPDTGEYEFDRLPAGRYFLAARGIPWYAVCPQPERPGGAYPYSVNIDPQLNVAYPMVYYPHALDSTEATPLEIKGGEQIAANLQMQPQPAVSLRLTLPPREPQNRGFPQLTQSVFGVEEPVQVRTLSMFGDQGVMAGLAPGQYHVQLMQPGSGRTSSNVGDIELSSGSNTLDLTKPAEMATVTLTVHGSGDDALPRGLQVMLRNVSGSQQPRSSSIDEKGAGLIDSLPPGDYRFQLLGAGRLVNVLALSINGKPEPDKVVHIAESGNLLVDLTASTFSASVDGLVIRDGKPDAASMVELIPAGDDTSESLFRRDQSDLDGSFTFANVVPGKYLVVAIDDGWSLRWSDPVALAPYLIHAKPLEVSATSPRQITLPNSIASQPR